MNDVEGRGINVMYPPAPLIGVKADYNGITGTDDTLTLQTLIDFAIANKKELFFPEDREYLIEPITVNGDCKFSGNATLSAKTMDQSHVIKFRGKTIWDGNLTVNAKYRALYAVIGENFGRSNFKNLKATRARLWGMYFSPVGNNNGVKIDDGAFEISGQKIVDTFTQVSNTNIASTIGYSTITLTSPIPNFILNNTNSLYFVLVNGRPYKVKTIVNSTTLEVFHLNIGDNATAPISLVVGGGINIVSYRDNGVGTFSSLDITGNKGIGFHASSLYGHNVDALTVQANTIGFGCEDYMLTHTMMCPYFEANDMNIVVYNYIQGYMVSPVLAEWEKVFFIVNYKKNGIDISNMFDVFGDGGISNYDSDLFPQNNPGVRSLTPGKTYAFSYSHTMAQTLTIKNDLKQNNLLLTNFIELNVSGNPTTTQTFTFQLSAAGETVEGSGTYTVKVSGKALIKLYKVGTDWKVSISNQTVLTSISAVPAYIGQMAIVGEIAYIGVGTATLTDWKKITD